MAKRTPALPTVTGIAEGIQANEGNAPPALLALIRQADAGEAAALDRLREIYREFPAVVATLSNLQYAAEDAILAGLNQPGAAATIREQMRRMKSTLASEDASPLEWLLVNRTALDWLHATTCELRYQQKLAGGMTLDAAAFYDKQAERAQRRYLRAVTTLAQVRKLLAPTVQVNIAEQQVNVAGTVNAGARPPRSGT